VFTVVPIPKQKTRTVRSPARRETRLRISSVSVEPTVGRPSVRKTTT
jgi:hypothetical protein